MVDGGAKVTVKVAVVEAAENEQSAAWFAVITLVPAPTIVTVSPTMVATFVLPLV